MLIRLIRFFSPKLAQRLELGRKEKGTIPAAYTNARQVAEVAGPWLTAKDLGINLSTLGTDDAAVDRVARKAAEDYHPKAELAAFEGARDGFKAWQERHKVGS